MNNSAARDDPKKPRFTAEDEKQAAEIRQTLATRGNRQVNPALAETVTLEITLAADAPPGERELRLRAPNGLSNPIVFCVGQLPETGDTVATGTSSRTPTRKGAPDPRTGRPKTEMEITLPTVVNGQILSGEVDRYRFTAKRGQRLTFAMPRRPNPASRATCCSTPLANAAAAPARRKKRRPRSVCPSGRCRRSRTRSWRRARRRREGERPVLTADFYPRKMRPKRWTVRSARG